MTKILGPDPLPGPATTRDTWESIGPDHQLVWIGSNQTLFWNRVSGEYSVFEYRWRGVPVEGDPYKPDATSKGTWDDANRKATQPKRGIVGGKLLHLGNQLLLHWVPSSPTASHFKLWRLQPKSPTDPVLALLSEGDWGSIGLLNRLVYLGGDLVLDWKPDGPGDEGRRSSFYNVWKLNRAATGKQDPLPTFVANGKWSTIGHDHEVIYLQKDRMLVWERARKVHPEEAEKKATSRYRVFRVDRTVKNFSQLLPDPVLADGLWYTIFEAPGEAHRLGPIGDAEQRMIDLVASPQASGRKVRIWPIHNDIPELTGVSGVTLRRTGNLVLLKVIPRKLMAARTGIENATVGPTLEELGDELRLSPQRTFQDLLAFADNGPGVKVIYQREFETAAYPGFADATRRLAKKGRGFDSSGRYGYVSTNQFRQWRVDPNLPLLFSLSPSFLTEVMTAGAKKQQVELRLKMAQPHFDALKQKIEALELALVPLHLHSESLASSLEPAYEDLGTLTALDILLGLMVARPKAGSKFDAAKVTQLRALVQTLIVEHERHTIIDPKHLQKQKTDRDAAASKVLGLLEDPGMLDDLQIFTDNVELTKTSLERLVLDTLRNAYELLLLSNLGDKVLDGHVHPAFLKAASLLELTGLPGSGNAEFDKALTEDIPPPAQRSALSILVSRTAPIPTAFGSIPGPTSVAVVIFHMAAPALARRIPTTLGVNRLGGLALRALCWCGNFDALQRADALTVVAKGDLALTRKINWTKGFQAGPYATGAIGLLNAITLFAAITSDEEDTRKKVVNIMNSAAGLGSASLQFSQTFIRAMNVSRAATVTNFAGRALGTVAGFITAGLGAVQAMEEKQTGDELGFWLAAVGAGAAYATAAGFLIGGGMAGATGLGAPAGAVLMSIGLVIGLGAGLLQVWRDIFTNATHSVVEAMVAQYGRSSDDLIRPGDPIKRGYGAYAFAHDKPGAADLKKAFEAVRAAHFPGITGFMPFISPDPLPGDPETNPARPGVKDGGIEMLYDAGFDLDGIKLIVDLDHSSVVLTHLLERRDWPLRRTKQKGAPPPEKKTTAEFVPIVPAETKAALALLPDTTRQAFGFAPAATSTTQGFVTAKTSDFEPFKDTPQFKDFLDVTSNVRLRNVPDYIEKTTTALGELYLTPTGRALLQALKATGRTIKIDRKDLPAGDVPNTCQDYDAARAFGAFVDGAGSAWKITPRGGSDCTVLWAANRDTMGTGESWRHVPAPILLGHELIHALHAARGDMLDEDSDEDPGHPGKQQELEELITVGLGRYRRAICENDLRREWYDAHPHYRDWKGYPIDQHGRLPQRPKYS